MLLWERDSDSMKRNGTQNTESYAVVNVQLGFQNQ